VRWADKLLLRVRSLLRRPQIERELDDELRFHLEQQAEENLTVGMPPDEARTAALRSFGGIEQIKEVCRERRGLLAVETSFRDCRHSLRMLHRTPAFTALAVLTLAIGIGANTAIFSIIRAVLLQPLPYQDANHVVVLWQSDSQKSIREQRVTPANYVDWRQRNRVFEDIAFSAAWQRLFNIAGRDGNQQVSGAVVSAGLFPILRVQPVLGRTFTREEDRVGGPLAALLGYELWRSEFGGDPQILGKTVAVDSYGLRRYTVVGVMPPGFHFPERSMELWLSIGWLGGLSMPQPGASDRCCSWFDVIARLKPAISIEQARAEMGLIAAQIAKEHRDTRFGPQVEVVPLLEQMVGSARMQLLLLLAAVGCVLLIACANLANLLLSRTAGREREIAVRFALGASRGVVVRQLLAENCSLSLLGGAAGILIALWGVQAFVTFGGTKIPRVEEARLDAVVLCFSLLLALATGILSGLAPALQASKPNLNDALKAGSRRGPEPVRQSRSRDFLVISEIALTLMMLASAGLLLRSFVKLNGVDPGFRPDHLLVMSIDMTSSAYEDRESSRTLFHQLMDRIQAMPGVHAVGGVTELPLSGGAGQAITIEGQPLRPYADSPLARTTGTTASYFRAMGVPLLKGRLFTEGDRMDAPPVVVINETMARRYWPGVSLDQVVGRRVVIGSRDRLARVRPPVNNDPDWMEVVGVVGDTRGLGLDAAAVPELYMSYRQWPWYEVELVVRCDSDPKQLTGTIRGELRTLSKNAIITQVRTMEQIVSQSIAEPRVRALLLTGFSAIALLLAAVGVYGVISYSVAQRTYEIGVRMAMGAEQGDVLRLIISQGMRPVGIGLAIGLVCSLATAHLLSHFLFDINSHDPSTLSVATAVLALVSGVALYLPARRAARIDPIVAIRRE